MPGAVPVPLIPGGPYSLPGSARPTRPYSLSHAPGFGRSKPRAHLARGPPAPPSQPLSQGSPWGCPKQGGQCILRRHHVPPASQHPLGGRGGTITVRLSVSGRGRRCATPRPGPRSRRRCLTAVATALRSPAASEASCRPDPTGRRGLRPGRPHRGGTTHAPLPAGFELTGSGEPSSALSRTAYRRGRAKGTSETDHGQRPAAKGGVAKDSTAASDPFACLGKQHRVGYVPGGIGRMGRIGPMGGMA